MKFLNESHKLFFEECCQKAKSKDAYHSALFYVLGLTEDCRNNINTLYNFEECCVKDLKGEEYGWITGTDIRIIRLAYNLFNNGCPTAFKIEDAEEKLEETNKYIPTNIFGYLSPELREYCFEGIRIRFEMVKTQ